MNGKIDVKELVQKAINGNQSRKTSGLRAKMFYVTEQIVKDKDLPNQMPKSTWLRIFRIALPKYGVPKKQLGTNLAVNFGNWALFDEVEDGIFAVNMEYLNEKRAHYRAQLETIAPELVKVEKKQQKQDK